MKEITEKLLQKMERASGIEVARILSKSRKSPLPAIRWMIGRELIRHGYSSVVAASELNIDHATLLYGRKKLKDMRCGDRHWTLEIEIEEKFLYLLGKPINQ